jgi:hypothetical protein
MFQSLRVELIPRETGNGYRNMQIVMFENESPIIVCLKSTRSLVTVC